jgi:hypothetical protein
MRSRDGASPALRIFAFAAFLFVLFGCGSDKANVAPAVTLDPKLENGDNVHSRLTVNWTGSDPDGRIDHYEFALDPPAAFTEEDITNGGPGITSVRIPGANGAPTMTRVSKVVNGATVSFDWVHTNETSHEFVLSSSEPDSPSTTRFRGFHALYVRAVDDDGASSLPDHVAFTSTNLAPVTRILSPRIVSSAYMIEVCQQMTFRWKGVDRDGSVPQRFLYKLLPIDGHLLSTDVFFADSTGWLETGEPEFTTSLGLPPSAFIFAVRAVDASGTVEPYLDWNRNAVRMYVFPAVPRVTISLFGDVICTDSYGTSCSTEIPANLPFRLTWRASTAAECSIDGYSWGLDLVSTEDSDRGWSTWGEDLESPVLSLSPGYHTFSVRARSAAGYIGLATLTLNVLRFAPDREALLVDDSFDNLDPNDAEHDAFWHAMIDNYAAHSGIPRDQFGEFSVHGDGDRGNLQPKAPSLSELLHYKLLIWESLGSGYNSDSALIRSTGLSNVLSMYLRAGGKLWLEGRMNVAATTPAPNLYGADLTYPKTELGPGDWAWDFLKLHSSKINNDKGNNNANLFHAARWFPKAGGGFMSDIYDTMSVDVAKLPLFRQALGGFSHCDAVFDPIFAEQEPDFEGDIDTLYAYGAAGPEVQGKTSSYDRKLCALRWHDSDPKPIHGRLQWFGFELYYFHADQAQNTFNQSLDWFREGP